MIHLSIKEGDLIIIKNIDTGYKVRYIISFEKEEFTDGAKIVGTSIITNVTPSKIEIHHSKLITTNEQINNLLKNKQ